jgi:hypothetical protein
MPDSPDFASALVLPLRPPPAAGQLLVDHQAIPSSPKPRRSPEMLKQVRLSLVERRLHVLKQNAVTANDPKAWEEGVTNVLKVSSSKATGWVKDAKLFEFFKTESTLKERDRLSAAVTKGFW